MSRILIQNRPVARIKVDGAGALSSELITQLEHALDRAEDLGPAAVMLIHVAGDVNPAAVRSWPGHVELQSVTKWERVLRRIERAGATTIVMLERACSAVALELLLVADRRLATRDFSMQCAMPDANVWPGMALYRLSRQIGESQARRLFLDGPGIVPQRAVELNIIDFIVDYPTNGDGIADILRYAPAEDFPIRRRLMQDSLSTDFDDALGAHLAACDRVLRRSSTAELALATTNGTSPA